MSGGRLLRAVCVPVVALSAFLAALLLGAVLGWLPVVALASVGATASEAALFRVLAAALPRQLDLLRAELFTRIPLQQALVLVALASSSRVTRGAVTAAVTAAVAYQLIRLAHSAMSLALTRLPARRPQARNLGIPEGVLPAPPALAGTTGVLVLTAASALPALGLLWLVLTGSQVLVGPSWILMAGVAGAATGACVPALVGALRRPGGRSAVAAVNGAVDSHGPDVVLYSDGGVPDLHWVTSWLGTLDALADAGRRSIVVVRHADVLSQLPPSTTPVLCLPANEQVIQVGFSTARVALYVANSPENTRLLRNPNLRSAFIGHGDSDKAASANPLSKMYDEVWVAGEAGRDRYLTADVGVAPERIRLVGRPQAHSVARRDPRDRAQVCSVLYAPTWEGLYGEEAESSLLHSGIEIVQALLAIEHIDVRYRPHPKTGCEDARFRRAHEGVLAALAAHPNESAVIDPVQERLHVSLDAADVLVTDVSSVISDFLASGKPYVVVNGTTLEDDDFRTRFPSAAGAYLVGRGGSGVTEAIERTRASDPLRDTRELLRTQLIGPPVDDPLATFAQAIDELGGTVRRKSAGGLSSAGRP